MAAFVLGNGVSRNSISVDDLIAIGSVYGCNAIYRTHTVTALIATDAPISNAIQLSGYSAKHRFYTRRPAPNTGALTVPQQYFGFSSGPIATAIAAMDKHPRIYMLGFDMGPTDTGRFNNLYAGTEFYKDVGAEPTYTGNWVKQIIKVLSDHPAQQFVRVQGTTTANIPELLNVGNLTHLPIDTFVKRINNKKDL